MGQGTSAEPAADVGRVKVMREGIIYRHAPGPTSAGEDINKQEDQEMQGLFSQWTSFVSSSSQADSQADSRSPRSQLGVDAVFQFGATGPTPTTYRQFFDRLALHARITSGAHDRLLNDGKSLELLLKLPSIFHDLQKKDYVSNVFCPAAVKNLLTKCREFWDPSPAGNIENLNIDPESELIIVGDLHGQLRDLLWIFFKYGPPSSKRRYLFNGDLVDRGGKSLEILLLLLSFKRDDRNSVFILRGNHEDPVCNAKYGFIGELRSKFGVEDAQTLYEVCSHQMFPLLPIMALCSCAESREQFCVMHGGVPVNLAQASRECVVLEDIQKIDRTRVTLQGLSPNDRKGHLVSQLLWNDPVDRQSQANQRGRSKKFGPQDTELFLRNNNLKFVVRSHEVPRNLLGVEARQGGRCYTVFSASNYVGSADNWGGVLVCRHAASTSLTQTTHKELHVTVREHWAPQWKELVQLMPQLQELNLNQRMEKAQAVEGVLKGRAHSWKKLPRSTPCPCRCGGRKRPQGGSNDAGRV